MILICVFPVLSLCYFSESSTPSPRSCLLIERVLFAAECIPCTHEYSRRIRRNPLRSRLLGTKWVLCLPLIDTPFNHSSSWPAPSCSILWYRLRRTNARNFMHGPDIRATTANGPRHAFPCSIEISNVYSNNLFHIPIDVRGAVLLFAVCPLQLTYHTSCFKCEHPSCGLRLTLSTYVLLALASWDLKQPKIIPLLP
jgi:hypothetical protein